LYEWAISALRKMSSQVMIVALGVIRAYADEARIAAGIRR
jgi:hypothetical protein